MQSLALGSNGAHIHRVNFFSFKIEEVHTLATSVEVSQSILNRRMIVWSGWDSSICQNYSKKKKLSDLPIFLNPDSKISPVTGHIATA